MNQQYYVERMTSRIGRSSVPASDAPLSEKEIERVSQLLALLELLPVRIGRRGQIYVAREWLASPSVFPRSGVIRGFGHNRLVLRELENLAVAYWQRQLVEAQRLSLWLCKQRRRARLGEAIGMAWHLHRGRAFAQRTIVASSSLLSTWRGSVPAVRSRKRSSQAS